MASITRVINLARHNQSSRRDTSFVMSYPNAAPRRVGRPIQGRAWATTGLRRDGGKASAGSKRAAGMTEKELDAAVDVIAAVGATVLQSLNHRE